MDKFEVYIAVGTDPDFFTGDYKSSKQFILDRTPATQEEIVGAMVRSRLFEDEMIIARDGWVVSMTWFKG